MLGLVLYGILIFFILFLEQLFFNQMFSIGSFARRAYAFWNIGSYAHTPTYIFYINIFSRAYDLKLFFFSQLKPMLLVLKNRLNETVLVNTRDIGYNLWIFHYFNFASSMCIVGSLLKELKFCKLATFSLIGPEYMIKINFLISQMKHMLW